MCLKWQKGKTIDMIQVQSMETWRQRLDVIIKPLKYLSLQFQKETYSQSDATQKEIDRLQAEIDTKNSYFDSFKTDMARTKRASEAAQKEKTTFGFDKVFAQYDHKVGGSIKYEDRTVPNKQKYTTVDAKTENA